MTKKLNLKIVLVLGLCVFWLAGILSPLARAGGDVSGGGDSYAQEFTSLGQVVLGVALKSGQLPPAELNAFQVAVRDTRVVSNQHLFLAGAEVDAINHPAEPRIEVSRSRWDGLKGNVSGKLALVFHEYSGIARLDDQRYKLSGPFLQNVKTAAVLTKRIGDLLDFAKTVAFEASYFKNHANKGTERHYCFQFGTLNQLLHQFWEITDDARAMEVAIDPNWYELRAQLGDLTWAFNLCQSLNATVIDGQPNDGLQYVIKLAGRIDRILEDNFQLIVRAKYLQN
ncbi:MAG TPA: hypothetical protein VJB59_03005 [Bdellovibrionota bacterium]|nr:hypothetical protein [Bdellovibrionota bacterium]